MTKTVLGHIDCPTCGKAGAMRVTPDRNGDPFGFCEDGCGQQLRIGGKPGRVRAFIARFPWAAAPVTVTVPESAPIAAPAPAPAPAAPKPVTAPAPAAKPVSKPLAKAAPAAPPPAKPAAPAPWFQTLLGAK